MGGQRAFSPSLVFVPRFQCLGWPPPKSRQALIALLMVSAK